jgi:cytochrome o ubiquinol oxidase subunit IV
MAAEKTVSKAQRTLIMYIIGFVLSLLLTLAAYFSVINHVMSGTMIMLVIAGLAIAQLLVQLLFFLHLGQESKPRFNLLIFLFMVLVVGIVVIGSLWIMHHLDYNMMPADMDKFMLEQQGAGGI